MTRPPTRLDGVRELLRGLLFGLLLLLASAASAQKVTDSSFDHTKTGFPLTGVHTRERCESCHLNGIFKGTPRDCDSCHTSGSRFAQSNTVKPARHIPTTQSCESCHSTQGFSGARFSHAGVQPGTCSSCHNGSLAPGKPSGHIQTQAACDSCHRSSAWLPAAGFDHVNVVPGTCATCHNGSRATGKSSTHIPVGAQSCDACHRSFGAWRPSAFNHTQGVVTNQCASCHSGSFPPADGRGVRHIPYQTVASVGSANCDTCHKAGFASWTPARFHANASVSAQCGTCHSGSFPPATGKPATPVHNGVTTCEACHKSTTSWASAKVDHATFSTATNCSSCHNGSTATGKPTTHIPVTSTNCLGCHTTSTWQPSRFNHTQVAVANQCSTCHSGSFPPADGRPARHIPYQTLTGAAISNCDTCHKAGFTAWTPARFHGNVTVSTQCALCHSGNYPPAVGKPATPVHAGVTVCENCHRSASAWSTVSFSHSPANALGTGTCDTCHNGAAATGKPGSHIPIPAGAARCDSCHRSQASFSTAVTMNHGVVTTAQCRTCHNGSFVSQGNNGGAMAKPANHIPESQLLNGAAMDCNGCHATTSNWGSPRMNHNGSLGGGAGWCKSCHATGTSYLGGMEKKSLTHERKTPVALDCSESGCHRPLGNKGAAYTKWD